MDSIYRYSKILKDTSIVAKDKTMELAKEHPYITSAVVLTGTCGTIVIAAPYIPLALGYGAGGIVKGTTAAKMMSIMGSGSKVVAVLQSIGAKSSILHLANANLVALTGGAAVSYKVLHAKYNNQKI